MFEPDESEVSDPKAAEEEVKYKAQAEQKKLEDDVSEQE
jgi:hypothetical protein